MNHKISDKIIMLRKEKGLTQIDLANVINYSDKVISKWERGESLPNIEALEELASYFKVSTDYLLGREEKSNTDIITKALEVKEEGKSSLLFRLSIFIPILLWIVMSFYGPEWFVVGGIVTLFYWIVYAISQVKGTFVANYNDHTIEIRVSACSIKMYIDDQLVDSTGVPFVVNYTLNGKLGNNNIKAKVSIFLFSKCEIFVD